ncbi:MAG: sigma-70 family RNA polymerase sigma factor [Acidobacteria bacterium]|nr:sigma-70 family RNA polymerase sigma factor [Acidobacteriota bacterium]
MAMPTSLFEETARQLFLLKPRATARRAALIPGDAKPGRESAEEHLVSEGQKAAARKILAAMPERDRAILRALYLEGKTVEDVAAELVVTAHYVRVMTHRAKARFRKALLGGAASLLSAARQDELAA